ncbi:DUF3016 domain-containing protein [Cognaticolwellia mytili]|uniref:DUF3016 domain-containing protein n=1 Tax=Cognaticolwellia mytili TaxID=1888913 RepID=UPI000A16D234|nr:DUF3016 domain-containing protein [Cognaticolwellia mytili]
MKKSIAYLIVASALCPITSVQAADVEVKWTNSDKYSDIDAGEEHRKHFKERTFKSFEKHFAKLAARLPENQKLALDITNIDLAGDVRHGGINRIRVVKDIYFPRMKFTYQLLNADNIVVKSEEVSLKDMGFLIHNGLKYRNQSLGYEKKMLDDWFKNAFLMDQALTDK